MRAYLKGKREVRICPVLKEKLCRGLATMGCSTNSQSAVSQISTVVCRSIAYGRTIFTLNENARKVSRSHVGA